MHTGAPNVEYQTVLGPPPSFWMHTHKNSHSDTAGFNWVRAKEWTLEPVDIQELRCAAKSYRLSPGVDYITADAAPARRHQPPEAHVRNTKRRITPRMTATRSWCINSYNPPKTRSPPPQPHPATNNLYASTNATTPPQPPSL